MVPNSGNRLGPIRGNRAPCIESDWALRNQTERQRNTPLPGKPLETRAGLKSKCDNVFIERLGQNGKYADVYLKAYETGGELRRGLSAYFAFYNTERTHQALDYGRPDDVYYGRPTVRMAA